MSFTRDLSNSRILIFAVICITCLFTPGSSEDAAESPELLRSLNEKEFELFSHLLGPNDTTLQQETKQLLAQYLVAQTLADAEKMKQAQAQTTPTSVASVASVATATGRPAAPAEPPAIPSIKASTTTAAPTTEAVTVSPEHVLNQVDKIINNAATGNVVGIVDESLKIRAPDPVRNLVGGILQLVFCNPLDRLFNRCRKQDPAPVANKAPTQSATPNIDRLTSRLTGNAGSAARDRAPTPNLDRLTSRLTGSNNNNNRLFG